MSKLEERYEKRVARRKKREEIMIKRSNGRYRVLGISSPGHCPQAKGADKK